MNVTLVIGTVAADVSIAFSASAYASAAVSLQHGTTHHDRKAGYQSVIYRCPGKGIGGCGGVSRKAAPVDEYVTTLVLMEQSKIALRKLEELPPWDKEQELVAVLGQIKETTQAYEDQQISGGRYFPLIERLEAKERKLKAEKRKYEAK